MTLGNVRCVLDYISCSVGVFLDLRFVLNSCSGCVYNRVFFCGEGVVCRWDSAVPTCLANMAYSCFSTLMTNLRSSRRLPNYPSTYLPPRIKCGLQHHRSSCLCWTVHVTVSTVVNRLLVSCIGKAAGAVDIYGNT